MRTFLSYDVTDEGILRNIRGFQADLMGTGADLKLVNPDILHFTIRFLGEVSQSQAEQIVSLLSERLERDDVFQIEFTGVGVFPNERRISVIWIGVDPHAASKLVSKAQKVNEILDSIPGLPRGDTRFSPHMTIARVKSARNKDRLIEFVGKNRATGFGSTSIKGLKLKESKLNPAGPVYSDLHVF